ncbi:MAG: diguanylate cyclase [Gammaproteobacteria bacterium]|nr:diguanylate cyclase [Gammaproteobacteria bacterium]MDH3561107.1 diguanylate cyclase [Gammaproteobacteria bacterium]
MSNNPEGKQRLLIVDDSKVIRVTARKILSSHFDTVEAVDGENAWEILTTQEPFSLVVSDLTMPNLDGFSLLGRIRNSPLPHISELPVIIITGANDSESTMGKARQAGATDFIGKPFDSVLLLARTQSHASAHAVTSTLKQEVTSLQDHATVDALTELANEISFMERGYQQLSYAIRHNSSLAMYRIEIDDFGHLFREHGEAFAESVIQTTAYVLGSVIRQEDTAARIGTARFALLSPATTRTGFRNLAERIRREVNARIFKHDNTVVRVSVSIGIAAPRIRRNTRLDELISLADQRLARALTQGGNQIVHEGSGPTLTEELMFEQVTEPAAEKVVTAFPVAEESRPIGTRMSLALDKIKDIEEIELVAPEYVLEQSDSGNNNVIEARAVSSPESVPDTFAGPVPENPFTGITVGPTTTESVPAEQIPTLSIAIKPDLPRVGQAADWFEEAAQDSAEDDELVADFSTPDPEPLQETTAVVVKRTEPALDPAHVEIDRSQWHPHRETVELPAPTVRRGLIARALASVGALFGWSHSRE